MDLGKKIKQMRNRKSLTQEELADRCELTKGYISQLENNLNSPSIATLTDILSALGSNLSEFFREEAEDKVVFTKEEFFEKDSDGVRFKWLIPNAQKNMMEPIRLSLSPGGSTYPDNPHEGEEFGYVLLGSITLVLGKRRIKVKKGESFYFKADSTHYIQAGQKTGAVLIWVSTPPSF